MMQDRSGSRPDFYENVGCFAVTIKAITDIFDSFVCLDHNALCFTCSKVLELKGEDEALADAQSMNIFTAYNLFRYADRLTLGRADCIFSYAESFGVLPKLLE